MTIWGELSASSSKSLQQLRNRAARIYHSKALHSLCFPLFYFTSLHTRAPLDTSLVAGPSGWNKVSILTYHFASLQFFFSLYFSTLLYFTSVFFLLYFTFLHFTSVFFLLYFTFLHFTLVIFFYSTLLFYFTSLHFFYFTSVISHRFAFTLWKQSWVNCKPRCKQHWTERGRGGLNILHPLVSQDITQQPQHVWQLSRRACSACLSQLVSPNIVADVLTQNKEALLMDVFI